jgi:hypothetical protein
MSVDPARSAGGALAPAHEARPRRWRWLRIAGVSTAIAVLGLLLCAWAILAFFESDRGRRFLVESLQARGVDLDYDRLVLRPARGQLRVEGLRLVMPEPHATVADHWLEVARFELEWSPMALLGGHVHVRRLRLQGIELHVVVDEDGRNSVALAFEALSTEEEEEEEEEEKDVPLSHTLHAIDLPVGLTLEHLHVEDVAAKLTVRLGPDRARTTAIDGLDARAAFRLHQGPLEATLTLSSPERDDGTRIALVETDSQTRVRELDLRWSQEIVVSEGSELRLTADAEVLRQTVDPELRLSGPLLALHAAASFSPERGVTRLELERFEALDDAASLSLALDWVDGEALPRLDRGSGRFALDALAGLLSGPSRELVAENVGGEFHVHTHRLGDVDEARLELRANIGRIGTVTDAGTTMIESATLRANAVFREDAVDLRLHLPVDRVSTRAPDEAVQADGVAIEIDTKKLRLDTQKLLASSGDARASARAERLVVRGRAGTFELEDAQVGLSIPLQPSRDGDPPSMQVAVGEADVALSSGLQLQLSGTRLDARIPDGLPESLSSRARFVGTGTVDHARVTTASREGIVADEIELELDGVWDPEQASSVRARARVEDFRAFGGPSSVRMHETSVTLDVERVQIEGDDSAVREAAVSLVLASKQGRFRTADATLATNTLGLSLTGLYRLAGTSSLEGVLQLGPLRLARGRSAAKTITAAGTIDWRATELVIDPARPLRSRGVLRAKGRLAPFVIDIESRAARGHVTGDTRIRVDRLDSLWASLAPEGLGGVDLHRSVLDVHATSSWSEIGSESLTLEHRVEARLSNAGVRTPTFSAALGEVEVVADHRGTLAGHTGNFTVRLANPIVNERRVDGSFTIASNVTLDGSGRPTRLQATLAGPEGAGVQGELEAELDPDGSIRHTERLSVQRLDRVAALLPVPPPDGLDLARLRTEITGHGTLHGALRPDRLGLADRWPEAAIRQSLEARVRDLRHAPEGLSVTCPEARVQLEAEAKGAEVTASGRLRVPRIELEDATHGLTIHDVEHELRIVASGLGPERALAVDSSGRIARVEQDLWSEYPMEDLTITGRLVIDGSRAIDLERFVLENPRGGTRLELSKQLGDARRRTSSRVGADGRFSLQGRLEQDFARLDGMPRVFAAKGRLKAPFSLDSGDGSLFRLHAQVELDDVDLELPGHEISIEGARAIISVEEAIEWTPEAGLALVPHTQRDAFSRVRFQDIQPFLSGHNHFEVDRLRWKQREAGPLVGSLRVERNVFAVDKLELQKGEARISGQLVVDYVPGAERVQFRGKLTGLRPDRSKDPVDANAAIAFDPVRLELDGRVQIVRISRKHLLELIDLVDPFREETSLNLLRRRLGYGYPKRVSIALSQGLMSMDVELGGVIGSMVKIGEIRGIPLGPFMNRHVAPLVPW